MRTLACILVGIAFSACGSEEKPKPISHPPKRSTLVQTNHAAESAPAPAIDDTLAAKKSPSMPAAQAEEKSFPAADIHQNHYNRFVGNSVVQGTFEPTQIRLTKLEDTEVYYTRVDFFVEKNYRIVFTNLETGDSETETFYIGNPTITMRANGARLMGLQVIQGINHIKYELFDFIKHGDNDSEMIFVGEGTITVDIILQ